MPRALLFMLAIALPWAWNSWNLSIVRQSDHADRLLRHDRTLATADDASYLAPVNDLLGAWGFIPGTGRDVKAELRTPGYGLGYMLLRAWMNEPQALGLLRMAQVLLFACAVLLLAHTLEQYRMAGPVRAATLLVFITLPLFIGFLFHTLTEAVTPALSMMVLCCALLYHRHGGRRELLAGLALWALLVLTRPVLAWVGAPLVVAAWLHARSMRGAWLAMAITVIAALPTLFWWGVNMQRHGGWLSIHPVYVPEATSVYRPTHQAFWELAKSWGMPGDRFHTIMEGSFAEALRCDTAMGRAHEFTAAAPAGHLDAGEQAAVSAAFHRWQHFTCTEHAPRIQAGSGFGHSPMVEEQAIVAEVERITQLYRRTHPFHHHVVVPVGVLMRLVLHSNLNLYMFQHTYRGQWWMEALRWACLLLHGALFMALVWAVFRAPSPVLRAMALAAWTYLLYLAWGQRGVEERYTLPVLYLAVVVAPFLFNALRFVPAARDGGPSDRSVV